jgi:hypothetical protein
MCTSAEGQGVRRQTSWLWRVKGRHWGLSCECFGNAWRRCVACRSHVCVADGRIWQHVAARAVHEKRDSTAGTAAVARCAICGLWVAGAMPWPRPAPCGKLPDMRSQQQQEQEQEQRRQQTRWILHPERTHLSGRSWPMRAAARQRRPGPEAPRPAHATCRRSCPPAEPADRAVLSWGHPATPSAS